MSNILTQAENQFLKSLLKEYINTQKSIINDNQEYISELFERAVPDTTNGLYFFRNLNQMRDYQRKCKAKLKKLELIQKKVKGSLSESVWTFDFETFDNPEIGQDPFGDVFGTLGFWFERFKK